MIEPVKDSLVELEVLVQLLMEDGQEGHRGVEILLLLVEVEIHGAEVDLQLGRVLLLLEELHLCFSFLPGLALLELLLSLASLTLLLLVVLLLLVIKFTLHFSRNGLRCAVVMEVSFQVIGKILDVSIAAGRVLPFFINLFE